jgi:hypothetical protein
MIQAFNCTYPDTTNIQWTLQHSTTNMYPAVTKARYRRGTENIEKTQWLVLVRTVRKNVNRKNTANEKMLVRNNEHECQHNENGENNEHVPHLFVM